MAFTTIRTDSYIVRLPGVVGGEPVISGTRITVRSVVVEYQVGGMKGVRAAYPRLSSDAIKAALSYYDEHRAEIDRAIEENEQAAYTAD